jgi:hypothetical protein
MILSNQKTDNIGAIASTLCLLHCIATPFVFIVQAGAATCCDTAPIGWGLVDLFLLMISLFAVNRSSQITESNWMKYSLWLNWVLLFIVIINEKIEWLPLYESAIFFPAITLILLHLYNKKHCQYNTTKSAVNEE